ncbi:hypothetical protein G6F37_007646 [Rhizopus arrhizus]|nr:hypothetical protein G6F38_010473 [Rhizopus arrhizus]KAG1156399.1 hypothetical protein G6F37_007646 [Rhizopus arrhizus]
MASNESLDTLPPSAKLALLHAQAAATTTETVTTTTTTSVSVSSVTATTTEEDKFVPSPDDPVVMDNSHFEPLISGDFPTPIGKKPANVTPLKKEVGKKNLDLNSEAAFPSLSASPRPPTVSSGWSANAASRLKSPATASASRNRPMAPPATGKKASGPSVTDVLELPANQQIANLPNKPLGFKSSADVIQQVINRTGTNIIASTNRSGTTTFLIQGAPADVARARKELVAGLVVKRTVEIGVPASTRRFIIGAKGANLKQIEAKSSTRINFPRKEEDDFNEEDPEEMVSVTIMGDAAGIKIAKEEIEKIVGEKTAKQTVKVDQFDAKHYLFLAGPQNSNIRKLEEEFNVKIHIPTVTIEGDAKRDTPITITGDKEKVQATKQALEKIYTAFEGVQNTISIAIPKRQHKYLHGKNGETLREIFNESGCTVELPAHDDSSENVIVRGPDAKLLEGLAVVIAKSRSVYVGVLDLASFYNSQGKDALVYARYALRYLLDKKTFRDIENDHNVQISVPSEEDLEKTVSIEIISKDEKSAAVAQLAVTNAVRKLTATHFLIVRVDAYLHQHIINAHRARLGRAQEAHKVKFIFPDEKKESSDVLIVYEGDDEKSADALTAASTALAGIVSDSSDYVSKTLSIPDKYHDLIRGPKGTTLNAILGADSEVSVRFGDKDTIKLRGLSKAVNEAVSAISKIYEQAQNDQDFAKPYSSEFFIPANFSAHVIGKSGIHINKLKEDLGVKIDIGENKSEEKTKNKKNTSPVKVTIHGIKTNVEAAKGRINSQIASLADQVTLSIKVPQDFHRYLIGPNGRYVKKLEDKYNVFIKFPKTNRGDESPSGNPDEIIVRGGKKGANAAKEELVELYEYEKEEQEKRKERELKQKQYEEKKKAEEKAAKESSSKQ